MLEAGALEEAGRTNKFNAMNSLMGVFGAGAEKGAQAGTSFLRAVAKAKKEGSPEKPSSFMEMILQIVSKLAMTKGQGNPAPDVSESMNSLFNQSITRKGMDDALGLSSLLSDLQGFGSMYRNTTSPVFIQ
jgi:hypothetical protein